MGWNYIKVSIWRWEGATREGGDPSLNSESPTCEGNLDRFSDLRILHGTWVWRLLSDCFSVKRQNELNNNDVSITNIFQHLYTAWQVSDNVPEKYTYTGTFCYYHAIYLFFHLNTYVAKVFPTCWCPRGSIWDPPLLPKPCPWMWHLMCGNRVRNGSDRKPQTGKTHSLKLALFKNSIGVAL